jgi:hypothetical protein
MRKIALALAAIIGMSTTAAQADGYWPRHHGHHGHGGCYNCNVYRGGGGDAGLALFGGLVGGMIIGGALAGANQNYYVGPAYDEPVCQRVFAGSVWNGWRWVNTYQTICN